jgi:hypothetical protein
VANARRILRNPTRFRLTKYWYACKIEETTDGRGCGACRQAGKTFKIVAKGCVETDGKIDERKAVTRFCQDQAQRQADTETQEELICVLRAWLSAAIKLAAFKQSSLGHDRWGARQTHGICAAGPYRICRRGARSHRQVSRRLPAGMPSQFLSLALA